MRAASSVTDARFQSLPRGRGSGLSAAEGPQGPMAERPTRAVVGRKSLCDPVLAENFGLLLS